MKKTIMLSSLGSVLLIGALVFFFVIRSAKTLNLESNEVKVLEYTFAKDYDYNFSALDDPFETFSPELLSQSYRVSGIKGHVVYVNVDKVAAGDEDISDLLTFSLECKKEVASYCVMGEDRGEITVNLAFEAAQAREYQGLIREDGLVITLSVHMVQKTQFYAYLSDTYQQEDMARIYTEFGRDATREIIVNYHGEFGSVSTLSYKQEGEDTWHEVSTNAVNFPFYSDRIYRVHLKDLEPDTTYLVRTHAEGSVYKVATMPKTLDRTINMVYVGDSRSLSPWFYDINEQIALLDVDFIVGTGDYVACEGELTPANSAIWVHFLDALNEAWIDEDGRVVPFLAGWGNHEASSGTAGSNVRHKDYLPLLFSFPNQTKEGQVGYDYIQFGDYFTLIMLDSFHINDIAPQTEWLESMKDTFKSSTHVIPVYHSAVFPSQKSFNTGFKVDIREQWLPIFQEMNVRIVMESCDHTYKKTVPIKVSEAFPHGYQSEDGMIFLGDGGWGAPLRNVLVENGGQFDLSGEHSEYWWIEDAAGLDHNLENSKHFHYVKMTPDALFIESINSTGELFDQFEVRP